MEKSKVKAVKRQREIGKGRNLEEQKVKSGEGIAMLKNNLC